MKDTDQMKNTDQAQRADQMQDTDQVQRAAQKETILVSACLLGENCKYSGGSNYSRDVAAFLEDRREQISVIPVCPEVMGGLATPRTPAEICGARVMTQDGEDVTREYEKGAEETARLAGENACRYAILKERSPSCGSGEIYDGTFSHTVVAGDGRTAGALKKMGVTVFGESRIGKLAELM